MKNLEERIYDIVCNPHLALFATITGDRKPWVRYVMAIGSKDLTIRFSTINNLRKVEQIKENPEVHLTCGVSNLTEPAPYLQIQGKAAITTSQDEKNKFWNDELKHVFTGPNDPNYILVIVKPYYIEYTLPNTPTPPEIWTKE